MMVSPKYSLHARPGEHKYKTEQNDHCQTENVSYPVDLFEPSQIRFTCRALMKRKEEE